MFLLGRDQDQTTGTGERQAGCLRAWPVASVCGRALPQWQAERGLLGALRSWQGPCLEAQASGGPASQACTLGLPWLCPRACVSWGGGFGICRQF